MSEAPDKEPEWLISDDADKFLKEHPKLTTEELMEMAERRNTLYCSFCGKSNHQVVQLIAGPAVFICDECVELCHELVLSRKNLNTITIEDATEA